MCMQIDSCLVYTICECLSKVRETSSLRSPLVLVYIMCRLQTCFSKPPVASGSKFWQNFKLLLQLYLLSHVGLFLLKKELKGANSLLKKELKGANSLLKKCPQAS